MGNLETRQLQELNAVSSPYGLTLRKSDLRELELCREESLRASGRVEFGGGILPKLVETFCSSPFLEQERYAETLSDLQEAFYYFKSEAMDRFSDEELLSCMADVFNGRAQGSTEYLTGTSLEALSRYAREGWDPFDAERAGDLF